MKKKLTLNKFTVASLATPIDEKLLRKLKGGEAPTMVGMSCITDILCCITTDNP